MTNQRKVIIDALKSSKAHPSADMVYDYVRARIPNVSLGTVYRNLESMYQSSMIVKIETPGGQKRFDFNTEPHPHFHCEKCGKIEDVPFELHAPVPDEASEWMKRRVITSSTLNYRGLCEECSHII
ncbi:MAG: transcriptional repressor [Spirochaetales bacterium]|nr:transcriptional repressor [Spirochaetales bacterium]